MTPRWARLARGQVVAGFSTYVAAFSHTAAGGGHPPAAAMLLALAFSSILCVFLAGVRLSRRRLAVSVAVSQWIYHGLFSVFGAAGTTTGAIASQHHNVVVFAPAPGGVAASAPNLWMLAAHAAAAALTFAVLCYGERLLSALGGVVLLVAAALLPRLVRMPEPATPLVGVPTRHRQAVPHRQLILSSSLKHRGPPVTQRFA